MYEWLVCKSDGGKNVDWSEVHSSPMPVSADKSHLLSFGPGRWWSDSADAALIPTRMHTKRTSQIAQAKYRLMVCHGVVVNEPLLQEQAL